MRSAILAAAIMAILPFASAAQYTYRDVQTYQQDVSADAPNGAAVSRTYPGTLTLDQCKDACSNDTSCSMFVLLPNGTCESVEFSTTQSLALPMGSTSGYKGQAIEPSPALAVDEEAPALGASQAPARRMRRQMRKLHTPYTF